MLQAGTAEGGLASTSDSSPELVLPGMLVAGAYPGWPFRVPAIKQALARKLSALQH